MVDGIKSVWETEDQQKCQGMQNVCAVEGSVTNVCDAMNVPPLIVLFEAFWIIYPDPDVIDGLGQDISAERMQHGGAGVKRQICDVSPN